MITATLVGLVKRWEGFRADAYDDRKQYTNGFGTRARSMAERITREEAEGRMAVALDRADRALGKVFTAGELAKMGQVRRDCLTSMIYQMGPGRDGFGGFYEMQSALRAGHWERAAREALRSEWARQTRDRAEEVAAMIESGEYGLDV